MHSRRNTNVCEGFFGSIKYYEDRFHCSLAGANGVTSSKVDEIFDVLAPNFIARGTQKVDDAHASKSTRKKRHRQAARNGRLQAAVCG